MLLFEDEARFGRISEGRRRCWAPAPDRPHAARQIVREYLYAVAAVSPLYQAASDCALNAGGNRRPSNCKWKRRSVLDGRLCALVLPWMDAQTMGVFLRQTAQTFAPDRCVMFLDRAGWHTAGQLHLPRGMKLCSLPAGSPELNPAESLWEHIRENYFGQSPLESLEAVEQRLCTAFRALDQHPETVRSLRGYRWVKTISLT